MVFFIHNSPTPRTRPESETAYQTNLPTHQRPVEAKNLNLAEQFPRALSTEQLAHMTDCLILSLENQGEKLPELWKSEFRNLMKSSPIFHEGKTYSGLELFTLLLQRREQKLSQWWRIIPQIITLNGHAPHAIDTDEIARRILRAHHPEEYLDKLPHSVEKEMRRCVRQFYEKLSEIQILNRNMLRTCLFTGFISYLEYYTLDPIGHKLLNALKKNPTLETIA